MNWIDIILLIFFLKSALQGFSRGLILSAFKTAGVIIALYMGVFYRDEAVKFISDYSPVENMLGNIFVASSSSKSGMNSLGVVGIQSITDMALGAIGFLLIFLGVVIIFQVPAYFIDGLVKLSKLTVANRVLGMVFAIGRSILWIGLLGAVVTPFFMAFPGSFLEKSILSSYILSNIKFLDFITPIVVKLI